MVASDICPFSGMSQSVLVVMKGPLYVTVSSHRIADVPGYDRLIKLGRELQGTILLDVGFCCERSSHTGVMKSISSN